MQEIFGGRQPIYDRNQEVYAYELLFRAGSEAVGSGLDNVGDGEQATAQVIVNTFTEIGLDNIVGSAWAFINLTKEYLLQHDLSVLPSERVVLEILEHVVVDQETIARVKALNESGYIIALDDFVYDASWRPLLELVKIIKSACVNLTSLNDYNFWPRMIHNLLCKIGCIYPPLFIG